jgi:uncharacterized protein (DUF4415 family)
MSKVRAKAHAAAVDKDNPPLNAETLARMRPARDVVPDIVRAAKIGRPKSEHPKEAIKLRLDYDLLVHFRASGAGWQTRINDTLRRAVRLKSQGKRHQRRAKR